MLVDKQIIAELALSVLEIEAQAILDLKERIDHLFIAACETLLNCKGRVVVTGMGKSGHIGRKIAATLSSTGTPALFLHPGEASHGDMGMIAPNDVVLALSNSGETDEILTILPLIKRLDIPVIAFTGNAQSTLAKLATIHIEIRIQQEACPLGLAPTASTTATLALGDALALSVLKAKGFTESDFAKSHPGGRLGKRLLLRIEDIMHKEDAIPRVTTEAKLSDALIEMSNKRLGFTTIVKKEDPTYLMGIFTDGDLRRVLGRGSDIHQTQIKNIMTQNCKTAKFDMLATEALTIMEKVKTFSLPVIDAENKLIGALNMHDLFKAGIV